LKPGLPTTLTFWDGITLSTNAVSDICLVIDSHLCGYDRPGKTGVAHDLMSSLMNWSGRHRVYYSRLEANDFVMGSEQKLKSKVREIAASQSPAIVWITQSSAVFLMGQDTENTAAELESETGVQVAVIPSNVLVGDYLNGYGAAMEILSQRVSLAASSKRPDTVAIVGYLMDRLEEDNQANLRELRRMCGGIGEAISSIWLCGSTFAELSSVAEASHILSFPYGRRAAAILGKRLECPVTDMELPIGLDGSVKWMRALGKLFGREKEAEAFISQELDSIVPRLERIVRSTFMNRNVALAAEPNIAPGLASYLGELGMRMRAVALRTRIQSVPTSIMDTLNVDSQSVPVITDPTLPELESQWRNLFDAENLDLIIATGSERTAAKSLKVPFFELGYPSYVRHALTDSPWIGFRGAIWLADALFNLLSEWEYRKY